MVYVNSLSFSGPHFQRHVTIKVLLPSHTILPLLEKGANYFWISFSPYLVQPSGFPSLDACCSVAHIHCWNTDKGKFERKCVQPRTRSHQFSYWKFVSCGMGLKLLMTYRAQTYFMRTIFFNTDSIQYCFWKVSIHNRNLMEHTGNGNFAEI